MPPAAVAMAALCRFTIPRAPAAPPPAYEDDIFSTPPDNPLIDATKAFMPWVLPVGGGGGDATVARHFVQGLLLPLLKPGADAADIAALKDSNLIEQSLGAPKVSHITHQLAVAGVLNSSYGTTRSFWKKVLGTTTIPPASLLLTHRDIVDELPFDVAAGARGGPIQGPDELRFLQKTTWWQLYDMGRRHGLAQPLSLLSEAVLMLGSHARRPTRDDGSSPLRVASEDLRAMLLSAQRLDAGSSHDLLADRFPRFVAEAFQAIPETLRTAGLDPVEHRDDLRDGLTLGRICWRRIPIWCRRRCPVARYPETTHLCVVGRSGYLARAS